MARLSEPIVLSAPPPPTAGMIGLDQGAYGANGNLELVAPGVDAGLWVLWFNADTVDRREGAALGRWSGALRFGGDWTFRSARITQMQAGPRFLEVVGVGAPKGRTGSEDLMRWWWTPAEGFLGPQPVLTRVRASSAIVEFRGRSAHALAVDSTGRLMHLESALGSYPRLSWRSQDGPGVVDAVSVHLTSTPAGMRAVVVGSDGGTSVWALADAGWQRLSDVPDDWQVASLCGRSVFGLDTDGRPRRTAWGDEGWSRPEPVWTGDDAGEEPWDDIAVVATSLEGGRLDLVGRRLTTLWHGHLDLNDSGPRSDRFPAPQLISSTLWSTDPQASVHRS